MYCFYLYCFRLTYMQILITNCGCGYGCGCSTPSICMYLTTKHYVHIAMKLNHATVSVHPNAMNLDFSWSSCKSQWQSLETLRDDLSGACSLVPWNFKVYSNIERYNIATSDEHVLMLEEKWACAL